MTERTIPVPWAKDNTASAARQPDGVMYVPYRNLGVRGIVATRPLRNDWATDTLFWTDEAWTLTHRKTRRSFGGFEFSSLAACRRTARALADIVEWDQIESAYDFEKVDPDTKRQIVTILRAEAFTDE